jgi:leader peptidase (prepilin peptidase) / N-methyltransferase
MEMLAFFNSHFILFIGFIFMFGLIMGSFLNVVIYRLPLMMERQWYLQCAELRGEPLPQHAPFNLLSPPSHCPACHHKICAWENIPLFSYLWLWGRCRYCSAPISIRYPLIELLTGLLSAFVAWHFGVSWETLAALGLSYALIALTFIDFDHHLLPDNITLPFLWLGLALSLGGIFTEVRASLIGAIAGYLSLWLVYHIFRLLTKKEGMGYGDFKLLALLGAWLGWEVLPVIVLLSSLVGAMLGSAWLLFSGQDRGTPIPFGPYLAIAGWIALLWGRDINQMYLSLSGFS